jgi:tRNA 2-thiouridine synthesizing protein A
MAVSVLDARGLKCPQPTLKITVLSVKMKPGDVLEVVADCPTFEKDVRDWCSRARKTLLWVREEGTAKKVQIQFSSFLLLFILLKRMFDLENES